MTRPPCAGRHELFDSTTPEDHAAAAALCAGCPIVDKCRDLLAEAKTMHGYNHLFGPRGTWAGELLAPAVPSVRGGCGTLKGYEKHRRAGEKPCDLCREEWNAYRRRRHARKQAAPCGTAAGEKRHRRAGEKPCAECLRAQALARQQRVERVVA